jgi:transcriptional regulator with GAF, ATPase, and Fis domain
MSRGHAEIGKGSLLIVDDDLSFRQTLEALLTDEGYEVRCAASGGMALRFAGEDPPDLILLDIRLEDMDGFEVCQRLRGDPRTGRIPVIFISGLNEAVDKVKGFAAGGVDYIAKPYQGEEVLARVGSQLDLSRTKEALRRTNEELEERVAKRAAEIENRLRFERLLTDLSARFVNIPPDRVDSEIEYGLKEILDFFQVDRVALLRILPGKNSWLITHVAYSEDIPPVPTGVELPISINPWAYDKLTQKREVVSFSRLEDAPAEAVVDKKTWSEWGIRSNLVIPIISGELVDHIIAINSVKSERVWPEEYFSRLRLLGETFVNALERRQVRLQIEERLRFEGLLSNLSTGFVNLSPDKVVSEINKGLRVITEFFDADRCSIGLFSEDGTQLVLAFEYHSEDAEPASGYMSKEQFPWYFDQLNRGNPVVMNRVEDFPPEAEKERQLCLVKGIKSLLSIPMVSEGKTLGSCALVSTRAARVWPKDLVQRFRLGSEVFASALVRKRMEEQLHSRLREIEALRKQLENENIYLREEIKLQYLHEEIVGRSEKMKKVLAQVEQVARTDSTVLIQGETGTGKELLARAIHQLSSRKDRPLVTVNCASLPPTLIESELFGREKGAYTGALTRMVGRFEVADGSTLFLDEIGELPYDVQSKLLRVLEEGRFERLGSTKTLQVNVRIIAATNRDLAKDVSEGRFRKDLFYRLNVFPLMIPPLRERSGDIPLLVWAFVRQFEKRMGKRIDTISRNRMEALQRYSWPGNVRELRNVIEHAMIVSSGRTLTLTQPMTETVGMTETHNMRDMERRHILDVLEKTAWRIMGAGGAAEILGMKRTTLQARMKKLGIKRPAT